MGLIKIEIVTFDAQNARIYIPNKYLSRMVCHIGGCHGGEIIKSCVLATPQYGSIHINSCIYHFTSGAEAGA